MKPGLSVTASENENLFAWQGRREFPTTTCENLNKLCLQRATTTLVALVPFARNPQQNNRAINVARSIRRGLLLRNLLVHATWKSAAAALWTRILPMVPLAGAQGTATSKTRSVVPSVPSGSEWRCSCTAASAANLCWLQHRNTQLSERWKRARKVQLRRVSAGYSRS